MYLIFWEKLKFIKSQMVNFRNCLVSVLILFSCSSKNTEEALGPERKLTFVLEDSVMVDVLEPLVIDDQQISGGAFLMREGKSRKPYLISKKGEIIKAYEILNEGPNGIGSGAMGYSFLGEDKWAAQGLFNGYHIYNLVGDKIKLLDPIHLGIFAMSIYHFQTFFRGFLKDGEEILFGIESNLFDPSSLSKENRDQPMYYDSVKTIFTYRAKDQELKQFDAYPETWGPRKERKYVGKPEPLIAYHRSKHEMALLPKVGNQLFIYDFSGPEPELLHKVNLSHRFRPFEIPEFDEKDRFSGNYPAFTDIRYFGERILVEFRTKVPQDIMQGIMAKSERYYELPEFKEATKTYAKPYYLIVENGKQIGVVDELPVHGALDFASEGGEIFINDNLEPLVEREYNVFYQLKLNM